MTDAAPTPAGDAGITLTLSERDWQLINAVLQGVRNVPGWSLEPNYVKHFAAQLDHILTVIDAPFAEMLRQQELWNNQQKGPSDAADA